MTLTRSARASVGRRSPARRSRGVFAGTLLGILLLGSVGAPSARAADTSIAFADDADVVTDAGVTYLLASASDARSSYGISGTVDGPELNDLIAYRVALTGMPAGDASSPPRELCRSTVERDASSGELATDWSCYVRNQDMFSAVRLAVEVTGLYRGAPDEVLLVENHPTMRILLPPTFDAPVVETGGSTVVLSGSKLPAMDVEVLPSWIDSIAAPLGAEPLCTDDDSRGSDRWSCEIELADVDNWCPPYDIIDQDTDRCVSARQTAVAAGDFTVASGFERLAVTVPSPAEPGPDPGPDPDPEPEPEPEPDPEPDPGPADPAPEPSEPSAPDPEPTEPSAPQPERGPGPSAPDAGPSAPHPDPSAPDPDPSAPGPAPGSAPATTTHEAAPTDTVVASSSEPSRSDPLPRAEGGAGTRKPAPSTSPSPRPLPEDEASTQPEADRPLADVAPRSQGIPGQLAAPTAYGTGLRTVGEVLEIPRAVALAALGTGVAFLILVAIPAELLYATVRSNYSRIFAWPAQARRRWETASERLAGTVLERLAPVAIFLVAAAIGSLAEPTPPNLVAGLRLYLALLLAVTIMNVVGLLLPRFLGRRLWKVPSRTILMPAALLLAAVSVLASRTLDLQPGFLFGLLVVVRFGRTLRREQEGALSALFCASFVSLGVVAWLLHSALTGSGAEGFWVELAREVLTAIVIGGIGSIVVSLLPLTFLEGPKILRWNKLVWAGLYLGTLAAFVLVILPLPEAWAAARGPTLVSVSVFGTFGVISVGTWAWFRFRPAPAQDAVGAPGAVSTAFGRRVDA